MKYFIGVDEVGTGALAGPAYICAAVTDEKWQAPPGLTDSKELTYFERADLYGPLLYSVADFRIVSVSNEYIDKRGLRQAWLDAVECALTPLVEKYPHSKITIDGDTGHPKFKARALIKADRKVPVVSAASVIAKVNRDMLMLELHQKYPLYDWKNNVGYGTRAHMNGMLKYGITPLHRRSFGPVKKYASKEASPNDR